MITIKKEGTQVKLEVDSKWPLNKIYFFYWECNREDFAALLNENLNQKMNSEIERIRRDSYNQGWKDAKSKLKKQTWFTSLWR